MVPDCRTHNKTLCAQRDAAQRAARDAEARQAEREQLRSAALERQWATVLDAAQAHWRQVAACLSVDVDIPPMLVKRATWMKPAWRSSGHRTGDALPAVHESGVDMCSSDSTRRRFGAACQQVSVPMHRHRVDAVYAQTSSKRSPKPFMGKSAAATAWGPQDSVLDVCW